MYIYFSKKQNNDFLNLTEKIDNVKVFIRLRQLRFQMFFAILTS